MQSCIAPPGPSMTSDCAIHDLNQIVEVDVATRQPLVRPAASHRGTIPKSHCGTACVARC